ncbi:MAG: YeeE/YedE thiosulfate transporter family protein [Polyangiales bacterium]
METAKALALGFLFGWSLNKAGLTHYARIVNVYRLRDMTVMRFMLTALVVGAFAIQAGVDLGFASGAPVPPTSMLANVVGGAVFGVGMATAGLCPGTIVAEAGEGRLDAWVAGLSGLVVGAIAFGLMQPVIMPSLARVGALGRVTVASLSGATPWLVLLVFGQLVALTLVLIARVGERPARPERSPNAGPPSLRY